MKRFLLTIFIVVLSLLEIIGQDYDVLNRKYIPDSTYKLHTFPVIQGVFNFGYNIPASEEIRDDLYEESFFTAMSLRASFQSFGKNIYDQLWRYPSMGLGYYAANFTNVKKLGSPNAVYLFIDVPIEKDWAHRKTYQSYMVSGGLSYNFRPQDTEINPINVVIGSYNNVYIDFAYYYHFKFGTAFDGAIGASFTHFSNGASNLPNRGMNMLSANIAIRYGLTRQEPKQMVHEVPEWKRLGQFYLAQAFGTKSLSYDGDNYLNSSTTIGYKIWTGYKHRWNAAIDIFYDEGATSGEHYYGRIPEDERSDKANRWTVGLLTSHEAIYKRWSFEVGWGTYVYRKHKVRSVFYQRIGARYRLTDNIFLGVALKARTFSADYVEWGLGYHFNSK